MVNSWPQLQTLRIQKEQNPVTSKDPPVPGKTEESLWHKAQGTFSWYHFIYFTLPPPHPPHFI